MAQGTLLTTTACLLNPNRNPHLNQHQIETYLRNYYGVEQILWLGDGIIGDDTDGHIDDITRFVNEDTVITVVEEEQERRELSPAAGKPANPKNHAPAQRQTTEYCGAAYARCRSLRRPAFACILRQFLHRQRGSCSANLPQQARR
jgi:hypothetical protein